MSKLPKELSGLEKEIRAWIQKTSVRDVIIFGSLMRGKGKPGDIDLCILIEGGDEKKSLDLVHSLAAITDRYTKFIFQINIITEKQLIEGNTLTRAIVTEGFSIKKSLKIAEIWGFQSKSLFIYTLKGFSPSDRVKFHFVLRGRYGNAGVLEEVKGKLLSPGAIMVPAEYEDKMKEVFNAWKIPHRITNMLSS